MTVDQLTTLKALSERFEEGVASRQQLEQLKALLVELKNYQTSETNLFNDIKHITF